MNRLKIIPVILLPLFFSLITYTFLSGALFEAVDVNDTSKVLVEIQPDRNQVTVSAVSKVLAQKGLTNYTWSLSMLARLRKDSSQPFKPGEYELSRAMTPKQLLQSLRTGSKVQRTITFAAGETMFDVARHIGESGLIPQDVFTKALTDKNILIILGVRAESFEGYLLPGTYSFSKPVTSQEIIGKMMTEGENQWSRDFNQNVDKLKINAHEMLTLASIVQKEALSIDAMPLIASILHNRLKAGLKLQADSTVRYGMEDPSVVLTKEDRERDHPYNTYVRFGVPPGPICNPGLEAINAVLHPAETTYLYFLPDGTGGYIYATSESEYLAARKRILGS